MELIWRHWRRATFSLPPEKPEKLRFKPLIWDIPFGECSRRIDEEQFTPKLLLLFMSTNLAGLDKVRELKEASDSSQNLSLRYSTGRIELRILTESDVSERYLKWLGDSEVTKFLEIRENPPSRLAELRDYVRLKLVHPDALLFGIFWGQAKRHIGNIKLEPIDYSLLSAEVGLLIGERSFWGKGLATESIGAVCALSSSVLSLLTLTAGCHPDNHGSRKAFLKNGFETVESQPEEDPSRITQGPTPIRFRKVLGKD